MASITGLVLKMGKIQNHLVIQLFMKVFKMCYLQ